MELVAARLRFVPACDQCPAMDTSKHAEQEQQEARQENTFKLQRHKWLRATVALAELVMQGKRVDAEHAAHLFYRGPPSRIYMDEQ